jgi:tyrosine-protein phosphatase YwqE
MFKLFQRRQSLVESGLLKGAVDNHSHILYGLDDGVKTCEDSLAILRFLEEEGVTDVWFTPHVMEDVPNTTEGIRARFEELKAVYQGGLKLYLAAEYMIDTLFEQRLSAKDLLEHGPETVLVETSAIAPPLNLWEILETMFKSGYRPLIAHPERYHYMDRDDYQRLYDMGCYFQLNLPSIIGFYGDAVRERAQYLLGRGMYAMVGSDCHRYRAIRSQYAARELKKDTVDRLSGLMAESVGI